MANFTDNFTGANEQNLTARGYVAFANVAGSVWGIAAGAINGANQFELTKTGNSFAGFHRPLSEATLSQTVNLKIVAFTEGPLVVSNLQADGSCYLVYLSRVNGYSALFKLDSAGTLAKISANDLYTSAAVGDILQLKVERFDDAGVAKNRITPSFIRSGVTYGIGGVASTMDTTLRPIIDALPLGAGAAGFATEGTLTGDDFTVIDAAPAPPAGDTTAPAVTFFDAAAASSSAINVHYAGTDNSGTVTHTLEWSATGTGGWTALFTDLTTPATPYLHSGLNPSTTYYYRYRVKDAAGNVSPNSTDSATTQAAPVTGAAPVASFNKSASSGVAPLTIQFTDTSTNAPTSWLWNFSDGTTSSLQNPSHLFAAAGSYTIFLTAANASGSSQTSQIVTVTAVAPPEDQSHFYYDAYKLPEYYFDSDSLWEEVTTTHTYEDKGISINELNDVAPRWFELIYNFDLDKPEDAAALAYFDNHYNDKRISQSFTFHGKNGLVIARCYYKTREKSHNRNQSWLQRRRIVIAFYP